MATNHRGLLAVQLVRSCLATGLVTATAFAQCGLQWLPGDGVPGANERIYVNVPWDPDGAGPLPEVVVLGGWFMIIGGIAANHVAIYDPTPGR
ncbi:MAG TPA: hypothetical protein VFZ65_04210 [Planctomycetota bacterium]|nr:hypothetical protein [Planctomycetota bacterium]